MKRVDERGKGLGAVGSYFPGGGGSSVLRHQKIFSLNVCAGCRPGMVERGSRAGTVASSLMQRKEKIDKKTKAQERAQPHSTKMQCHLSINNLAKATREIRKDRDKKVARSIIIIIIIIVDGSDAL